MSTHKPLLARDLSGNIEELHDHLRRLAHTHRGRPDLALLTGLKNAHQMVEDMRLALTVPRFK